MPVLLPFPFFPGTVSHKTHQIKVKSKPSQCPYDMVHWHTYLEFGSIEINIVRIPFNSIVEFSTKNTNVWTLINETWTFSLLHWFFRNSISFILCSGIDLLRPSTIAFEIKVRQEEIFTELVWGVIALNESILEEVLTWTECEWLTFQLGSYFCLCWRWLLARKLKRGF